MSKITGAIRVFYRISDMYIDIKDKSTFFECVLFDKYIKTGFYNDTIINETLGTYSKIYYIQKTERYLSCWEVSAFIKSLVGSLTFAKYKFEYINTLIVERLIQNFKIDRNEIFIDALCNKSIPLEDFLRRIKDYCFFDKYALFLRNQYTDIWSCESTDIEFLEHFLTGRENNIIKTVYESDFDFLKEEIITEDRDYYVGIDVSRYKGFVLVKIRITDEQHGILILASEVTKLNISAELVIKINSAISGRIIEDSYHGYEIFEKKFASNITDDYSDLSNVCLRIKDALCFEFVFIVIDTPNSREVFSSDDNPEIINLSCSVYFDDTADRESDLVLAHNNGHWLSKCTDKVKNISVLPRVINQNEKFIVFAVNKISKNKRSFGEIIYPSPNDYDSLSRAVTLAVMGYKTYLDSESQRIKMEEQKRFNKVFKHEIRTPISKFALGPRIIEVIINESNMESDAKRKIHLQLEDIKSVAARLKYITDAYHIDQVVQIGKIEVLSLLQDVVMPIRNTHEYYIRRNHGVSFIINHSSLQGVKIKTDRNLIVMVLNALVDNGAKYSTGSDKYIRISCLKDNGNVLLTVENKGIKIEDSEFQKIFLEGYRGSHAVASRIEGTGIGLYLAKKIMKTLGGDLVFYNNGELNAFTIIIGDNDENINH